MRTRISRYQILQQLYSGATADLLLGSYESGDEVRYAALKQIRPEHVHDQRFLQRLLGEVQLTVALGHRHLVEVHDVLAADGDYVIAMEYIHGADLRTLLAHAAQRGAFVPIEHVCAIAAAVASGLHHAHELRDDDKRPLGVVHRNVSPSNILLGYDGSIKLGDFGTPKASMQRGEDAAALHGRSAYFSPEQCRRAELDRRSDVYSLGVVLYELATTSRVFSDGSDEDAMARIVGGDVAPPNRRRPDLPGELSAIISRAMAVDPAARYANAGELRSALDHVAGRGKRGPATSLAAYLRKVVGERPEPWRAEATVAMPTFLAGNTWVEPPRGEFGNEDVSRIVARPSSGPSTVAPASEETAAVTAQRSVAAPLPAPPPAARPRAALPRAAMIGVPLIAMTGVVGWRLAASPAAPPAIAVAPAAAQRAPGSVPSAAPPATLGAAPAPATAAPVPAPSPVAAGAPEAASGSAEPNPRHRARAPEPTGRSRPHTSPSPPPKMATGKNTETAAAPPVAPPEVPVAAPPPAPASPVAAPASAAVASAPAAAPRPAAPPPAAAAAPVIMARVIPPLVLDANRISGNKDIAPDSATLVEIRRAHKDKVTASFKLCVNTEGTVSTISALQGTGFAAFDAKIENTIREKWRYRPLIIDGKASPVCTKFGFVYWPPVL